MSGSHGTIASSQYAKTINKHPINPIKHHRSKYGAKKVKKEKKMGWFRRKFMEWSRQAWEDSQAERVDTDVIRAHDGINGKTSIRFTVYPASGGFVIESYKQDRYKDSEGPTLTIVNHGDDLGKTVEHILTMEALKS